MLNRQVLPWFWANKRVYLFALWGLLGCGEYQNKIHIKYDENITVSQDSPKIVTA